MSVNKVDANFSISLIQAMASAIAAHTDQLTTLDSTVGDGDHGVNITKALQEAVVQVNALAEPTLAEVWRTAGKTIQNSVGGASGLLFGAFFIGAARTMKEKSALEVSDIANLLTAGLAAVQKRGKAQPGDKTMVDALANAANIAQASVVEGLSLKDALQHIAKAAQEGAEATSDMVANHGRAKFLGERSKGFQDAGATSMAIMLAAWAEIV